MILQSQSHCSAVILYRTVLCGTAPYRYMCSPVQHVDLQYLRLQYCECVALFCESSTLFYEAVDDDTDSSIFNLRFNALMLTSALRTVLYKIER